MTTQDQRAAFESAYIGASSLRLEDIDLEYDDAQKRYHDDQDQSTWEGWQMGIAHARQRRGEPVAWTLTQQQVIALAEELIVGASTLGGMDDDGIECDVRLMVRMPGTIADDDGNSNDKPILAFCLDDYPEEGVYPIDPAECKPQAAPQPAEPCGVPERDKPVCGAQNEHQTPQVVEPVKVPDHLIERLKKHCEDKSNTAFARSSMREAIQYLSDQTTIEPVKVPSAAEISDVIREVTGCPDIKNGDDSLVVKLSFLLSHYGQPAQPATPVAAQTQPSGISGDLDTALKTEEAFNADIPVTEQEEEEWKRIEYRK